MNIHCAYTELVPIHKLIKNPKNNNLHPSEQIERLAKIIDFNGIRQPIVVSKRSGFIVKGHARLAACEMLGYKELPVDYQDYANEAAEYADMTADNEIARWAELDKEKLQLELIELEDLDLDLLGIRDFELPNIDEAEMPDLKDSEKSDLEQITFTLHFEQAGRVRQAIEKAIGMGSLEDELNKNKNGNALARICELFLSEC